ncbi:alanine--tRNA ligase [Lutispora thermophila]|uniref:Alanine--tRNA ligase n=1 Tax=Lutispora thermophila DSM 19022 TaxID=1122184 RepID=A0A1M6F1V6_9FIRM|nr:alanine--tRNA ligase [Lutispora thermophila]SHI91673.1 alanyl-tRNA synthetase [Lutispora thermophila DSM 19022]
MEKLGLNEIREKFLSFFETKEHLRLKSASLIPEKDKSLLLINSGMAPLKPYFTGQEVPPKKRVTTCQKCIRTPDIERVGKTARHGTFFEMLGNFSFGDYFKSEAISWAWEFCTQWLKMPEERLWVTIYQDDDEAFEIWNKKIGLASERIVRMGKEDNFWEIGLGPCGPCSEIYFDRGEKYGCGKPDCKIGCDCDRYIEFWNLVFTQFDKDEEGNYNKLAKPNIDTGMGLERMSVIMQDVYNIFEIDTIRHTLDYICSLAGVEYGKDPTKDVSIRVITDHIRSVTFLVSDGVLPSNEGRGYVLRRLLRRGARHGKLLGFKGPFLSMVSKKVIEAYHQAYPELKEKEKYIQNIIKIEEERFEETLEQGLEKLQEYIKLMNGTDTLSGEAAFKLYDTYGFPLDLTKDMLEEHGLKVDEEAFIEEMERQRKRARTARGDNEAEGWKEDIYSKLDKNIKTTFVGYDNLSYPSIIKAIIADNTIVDKASEGMDIGIILSETPFYAESGGQVADTGVIKGLGFKLHVYDCKKVTGGRFVHHCKVTEGQVAVDDSCTAHVDKKRRLATARNHSVTHLLHKALRDVLGTHVEQAGSLVEKDRLRFDFTHFKAMTGEELAKVEREVNSAIWKSMDITISEVTIDEAKAMGAMALFGEKYGDIVRVVKMGDYSIELCGGTHMTNTSQIGMFKIISESGIAAGIRRIEAITGEALYEYLLRKENIIQDACSKLKTNEDELIKKIEHTLKENKDYEKEIQILKDRIADTSINDYLSKAKEIGNIKYIVLDANSSSIEDMRALGDKLKEKLRSGIVILYSMGSDKTTILAMASKQALSLGVHAGNIIKEITKLGNGSGGGRPDMAQGGIKDNSKLDEIKEAIPMILKKQIE